MYTYTRIYIYIYIYIYTHIDTLFFELGILNNIYKIKIWKSCLYNTMSSNKKLNNSIYFKSNIIRINKLKKSGNFFFIITTLIITIILKHFFNLFFYIMILNTNTFYYKYFYSSLYLLLFIFKIFTIFKSQRNF